MSINSAKFRKVIDSLKGIINTDGYKYERYLKLAFTYESAGDKAKAITYYQECVRINPNQNLYKNIGLLYYEMNDFYNAMKYLEKTTCDPEVGLYLGICCLKLNALKKAEQILRCMPNKKSMYALKLAEYIDEYKNACRSRNSSSDGSNGSGNSSDFRQFYKVMEAAVDSSKENLKHTYRELVKAWHPDRFSHDPALQSQAEERMKVINEAYYRLCNQ